MRALVFMIAVALLGGAGCRERAREAPPATGPVAQAVAAPAAGAATGMCVEHGVLEAVCTKCNPKLVPVFQARGDWCAEHGFPESFCPICHPERGGQPATDVAADEAPADGTKIRFKTKETARLAGIETVQALERPTEAGVDAVARLAYEATRVARVNARAAGVVRAIHVDVGSRVRRGTPLAVIESAIVGADQSKLLAARAHVEVAAAEYGRTQDLVAKGIVPAKDLLLAQQELEAAKAEQQATIQALHVVGAEGEAGSYTLAAPLGGVVSRRNIGLGTLVDVEDMLFEIVDPSFLWAEIDVREADLAVVRVGQDVVLTVDGLGERQFRGRIASIAPAIDPHTRTATARARLANPDGTLRANMYGRARIAIGEPRTSVAVPPGAVQRARGIPLVFVRLADDLYETRRVRLGPTSGDLVAVAQGVHPGERVVTVGSFLLKTETLKESIGAGCCEIEPKK